MIKIFVFVYPKGQIYHEIELVLQHIGFGFRLISILLFGLQTIVFFLETREMVSEILSVRISDQFQLPRFSVELLSHLLLPWSCVLVLLEDTRTCAEKP